MGLQRASGGQSGGWAEGGKSKKEAHTLSKLQRREAEALAEGMERVGYMD